jgi:hypothetical protein
MSFGVIEHPQSFACYSVVEEYAAVQTSDCETLKFRRKED